MSVTSIEETSGNTLSGYTGDSVDYSSLTFVATYDDESTGSVTPASCTPSVWGEAGTETITFHFDGTDVTCEVEGTAIAPVVTSLTISGTLTGVQEPLGGIDNSGLTFTYGLSNGQSVVKEATSLMDGHDGYFDFNLQALGYDFYAVPSGSGLDIEDPTKPDASWKEDATGTQTVGSAPDLTGITFTAHYNDSSLDHEVDDSDITVSPATWAESGSQTLTMSYTDEYGTASTTATVTVNES